MITDKQLSIIVAMAQDKAIGINGDLLCHMPADLKHFKTITMGGIVVMGRKTWDSLPKGALPGRRNIVITRNTAFTAQGAEVAHSLEEAINLIADDNRECFIIGGAQLYSSSIGIVDKMYITLINATFDADTFFPEYDPLEWDTIEKEDHIKDERNPYDYTFLTLIKKNQR